MLISHTASRNLFQSLFIAEDGTQGCTHPHIPSSCSLLRHKSGARLIIQVHLGSGLGGTRTKDSKTQSQHQQSGPGFASQCRESRPCPDSLWPPAPLLRALPETVVLFPFYTGWSNIDVPYSSLFFYLSEMSHNKNNWHLKRIL